MCTCLQDREQSLVQRSILDFLLVCLPMHNKQLTKIDMMKIITVALHLLLKRDMSLNRRIYAWFLGTEQSSADNTNQDQQQNNETHSSTTSLAITNDPFDSSSYFIQYTQENLIQALLHALETVSSNALIPAIIKSKPTTPDENHALLASLVDAMPSTWTLTKLIRVLIILGMDNFIVSIDHDILTPSIYLFKFMNTQSSISCREVNRIEEFPWGSTDFLVISPAYTIHSTLIVASIYDRGSYGRLYVSGILTHSPFFRKCFFFFSDSDESSLLSCKFLVLFL